MRRSLHLRSELFPYIYSAAWKSHVTSVGFNRPLYIDYPGGRRSLQNPQEFLWGDAFLVAPITEAGMLDPYGQTESLDSRGALV